jgi:hypothetical protein
VAVDKKTYSNFRDKLNSNFRDKLNVGNGAQAVLECFTYIPEAQSSLTLKNAGHFLNN